MDTMGYNDRKKSGKGVVIGLLLFFAVGTGLIYFAMTNQKQPVVIGGTRNDTTSNVEIYENRQDVKLEILQSINFEIKDEVITDTSNSKMKSNITIPVIYINNEECLTLNQGIKEKYTMIFNDLKQNANDINNKYTYNVSYEFYDNIINDKRILSVIINQKISDDQKKNKTTMNNYKVYNIDLSTNKIVKQEDLLFDLLGKEYNTIIKETVKNYIVNEKKYINEEDYAYTCTGLEEFYIKEGNLHLVFNENDIIKDKYLDILISTAEAE